MCIRDRNGPLAKGLAEAARLVIEADGFDPNVANPDGMTPLIFTAQKDMPAIARALLEANADPNAQKSDGATALLGRAIVEARDGDEEKDGLRKDGEEGRAARESDSSTVTGGYAAERSEGRGRPGGGEGKEDEDGSVRRYRRGLSLIHI